jgi:hypothetical protein
MVGSSSLSGADVGHLTPGLKNQPSVASLVWSYDSFAARESIRGYDVDSTSPHY